MSANRLPNLKQIKYVKRFLSGREKIILAVCGVLFITSLATLWLNFYNNLPTNPDYGGDYTEGLVGAPQYLNPLHAPLSSVDAAISRLIYSSLFTRDADGRLINDLAEKTDLSPDGKSYTITITKSALWHNGESVTADDVVFTFNTLKDPQFKSPLRTQFQDVEISKVDDYAVRFDLGQGYSPFPELLTFGIMPKNLWQDVSPFAFALAELNIRPIGSGPYQFLSLVKDKNGNIKTYTLIANEHYYRGRPFLDKIICRFFNDQSEAINALNNGKLDGLASLSEPEKTQISAANSFVFHRLWLPEYSALFFNLSQTDDKTSQLKFRRALSLATDREKIKNELYGQDARLVNSLFLPENSVYAPQATAAGYDRGAASQLLADLGWKTGAADNDGHAWLSKNNQILTLNLTIPENDDLVAVAQKLQEQWAEIGVKTKLNIINRNDLSNAVLRSRAYSLLLYNVAIGSDPDPYPLWHSSQAVAGGFNLSGYKNSLVDKLIINARGNQNQAARQKDYAELENIVLKDQPAIFLFNQPYLYPQNKKIKGFSAVTIASPEDRFNTVAAWHLKEKRSWKF